MESHLLESCCIYPTTRTRLLQRVSPPTSIYHQHPTLLMSDTTRKRRPPKTYSRRPPVTSHSPKRRWPPPDAPPSPPQPPPTPGTPDTPVSPCPSTSPPKKKPTFTFFTRTIHHRIAKPTPTKQKPLQKLTQSIIDLGQALRTTCRTCGMSYHPSTPDDEALHKRFHAKSVGGVDFPPCSKGREVWKGSEDGEEVRVLLVDRKSSAPERRKVREVMEVVDIDLGAGEITDAVLWEEGVAGERFKAYLYIQGKKCIGLLLAERITKAFYILNDTPNPQGEGNSSVTEGNTSSPPATSSSISISSTPQKALLGISRIWTCSSHRRQGVARKLLECARSTFIYGMAVEKGHVAFSQPTESGVRLARGWFGEEEWKIYVEQV